MELLADEDILEELENALLFAEASAKILRSALVVFSKGFAPKRIGEDSENREDWKPIYKKYNPETRFWSRLETPFSSFLILLKKEKKKILVKWKSTVIQSARDSFNEVFEGMKRSAKALEPVLMAEQTLERRLWKL